MVYIDDYNVPFGNMIMCHMIADTQDELDAMAHRIGVNRKWKHNDHFDICLSKKKLAIQYGAVALSVKEFAKVSWEIRKKRRNK